MSVRAIIISKCPKCRTSETALVDYLHRCSNCGYPWFVRKGDAPIIGWHDFNTGKSEFLPVKETP
jgi:predicted nucleic-acid-binding Zn-ribbon protein